jgi:hypothetical protein
MSEIQRLIQEKLIQERLAQKSIEVENAEYGENNICVILDFQTIADLEEIAVFLATCKENLAEKIITRAIVEFKQTFNQDKNYLTIGNSVIDDDESEDFVIDDDEQKRYQQKNPKTNLRITMSDGDVIFRKTADQAFVEAITRLNIEAVRRLQYKCCRVDLVSNYKSHESQYSVGKYWIMTRMSTLRKKEVLEKIANTLSKKIRVEVI